MWALLEWLAILVLAIFIDHLIDEFLWKPQYHVDEPPLRPLSKTYQLHPSVWVNRLTKTLEPHLTNPNPTVEKVNGILLALSVLLIFILPIYFGLKIIRTFFGVFIYVVVAAVILKFSFTIRLETEWALAAARAVEAGDLSEGREYAAIFSRRDVENSTGTQIASAIVESIAENVSDYKLSPFFYYVFLGVPGAFACRIINWLDGMVGFKDSKHIHIGWFSATLDTIVNYIPSRLSALLVVLASAILGKDYKNSWRIARRDRKKVTSVNHGWPIAAMSGALQVRLEKPSYYVIGDGQEEPSQRHIIDALKIRNMAIILCVILFFAAISVAELYTSSF